MNESEKLASLIDHTLLRKDATEPEFEKLCQEAVQYGFKTVCVEAQWLPFVTQKLKGSSVLPIAVVCFPEGTASSAEKIEKTRAAVKAGAQEIDMVLNRNLLKARKYDEVLQDIRGVVESAEKAPVKVILETSELNQEEKAIACALSKIAGAAFVKTSTGFSKSGATVEDIRLMRQVVGPEMGVKASGGVRSYEDAIKMVEAGASRLGTSASVAIVTGSKGQTSY
ncbi:MAG: deoxyribose-phosphate aldolase [Proteobacteria bacterium]|nr:deoxyribose-phosphate aldolase [Pseudomonadota bacterium]